MSFRYLALASFIATVAGRAAVPLDGCLVCGDRNVITVPDAVFITPDQPAATCDQLQTAGLDGQIQIAQCLLLSGMISDLCGCMPGDLPGGLAPTPVDAQGTDDGDSGDDGSNADKTLKDSKIKSSNRSVDTPAPADVKIKSSNRSVDTPAPADVRVGDNDDSEEENDNADRSFHRGNGDGSNDGDGSNGGGEKTFRALKGGNDDSDDGGSLDGNSAHRKLKGSYGRSADLKLKRYKYRKNSGSDSKDNPTAAVPFENESGSSSENDREVRRGTRTIDGSNNLPALKRRVLRGR